MMLLRSQSIYISTLSVLLFLAALFFAMLIFFVAVVLMAVCGYSTLKPDSSTLNVEINTFVT